MQRKGLDRQLAVYSDARLLLCGLRQVAVDQKGKPNPEVRPSLYTESACLRLGLVALQVARQDLLDHTFDIGKEETVRRLLHRNFGAVS
jgi:hypothetical protein